MMASAFAPGKLILSGEHAVVYGHRALAAAVSLGTTVTLYSQPGPTTIRKANFQDDRLFPALLTVLPAEGVGVEIESTLPIGCGMGSSAALAVATVRARAKMNGTEADFSRCYEDAFRMERLFHGTPSGIDHSISALGGLVAYRRRPEGPQIDRITLPRPLFLVVVDSGRPLQSTAELVAGVRQRAPTRTLEAIGALTEQVIAAMQQNVDAGPLLNENHRLLQELGVSTPGLDQVVEQLRDAGASGAKLAGAGGGGVAFGLYPDLSAQRQAVAVLQRSGRPAWAVTVG